MSRLAASDARDHFAEILNRVAYGGDRVVVERRGKELAAIVSLDDLKILEAIEDRLDVDDALAAIEEVEREGTTPWETIKAALGLCGLAMAYQIEFSPAAQRQLKKLSRGVQGTLALRIDVLTQDPRPKEAKELSAAKRDLWRVREGDYRVVYEVRDEVLVVLVVKIGHRRETYRRREKLP